MTCHCERNAHPSLEGASAASGPDVGLQGRPVLGLTTQGDKYEDTCGSGEASMVTTGIAPESAGHVTVIEERKEDVTGNVTGGRN